MDWPWNGINDLCKKNAAALLCLDIRQPKDFLLEAKLCHEDATPCVLCIHRVERTARYQENYKPLLFLLQRKKAF